MRGEFVDVGGARLYCYAFGTRGAGEPIVLVHGAFTSSHLWQDVLPRLPKGHRVLVLDLLGHGRSDPAGVLPMTVAGHAERLVRLLDTLGVSAASLAGHGMGAAIAMQVTRAHPARVTRLALVNPSLVAATPRDAVAYRRLARLARLVPLWRRLSPGWLASALHSALLPSYSQRSAGVRSLDFYLKTFRTRDGRDSACAQLLAFAESRARAAEYLTPNGLRCPVTLVVGEHDPLLPPARAERLAAALQIAAPTGAMVQRIPGVAHVAPEEAPDRLGTLIAELLTQ